MPTTLDLHLVAGRVLLSKMRASRVLQDFQAIAVPMQGLPTPDFLDCRDDFAQTRTPRTPLTVWFWVLFLVAGTYHGIKGKHLQAYLDEYDYRYNRRNFHGEEFNRQLNVAVSTRTVTYAERNGHDSTSSTGVFTNRLDS